MTTLRKRLVTDPEGAAGDPAMPWLGRALDPLEAGHELAAACPALRDRPPPASISIMRYRPGRRCLIRYRFPDGRGDVIGKATLKGVHRRSLAVQTHLFANGFAATAADGIAVPEPLGAVPALGLWLQRAVGGRPLQAMLRHTEATAAAARAGEALAKLHRSPPAPGRPWSIADELAVLEARLCRLADDRPDLACRAESLLAACRAAAEHLPEGAPRGIHRDFYPEQVLIDGRSLHLVDLDLYALGDPALDAGNFVAHLIEAAIREMGEATALDPLRRSFLSRFLALSPAVDPRAVAIYTLLSLARLVQISTTIAGRDHATLDLLAAAEAMGDAAPLKRPASGRATS